MATLTAEGGSVPFPKHVAVIGGGRWARVIVDVLIGVVPDSVALSVHSRRNADSMLSWLDARGLKERVQLGSEWPRAIPGARSAVIIANAARDHQAATEWAISNGASVLIEKPIALNFGAAQRLLTLAHARDVRLAAANVFLFARYIKNFSRVLGEAGTVKSLMVDWADPAVETRYGEPKRYDSSLPVFSDCLPHVVTIAGALLPGPPDDCRDLQFRRGGATLDLALMAGGVPCAVRLERNSERRRRLVRALTPEGAIELDFSLEPGIIRRGESTSSGDPDWCAGHGPVAMMLFAFLNWAAGGKRDDRLDIRFGLQACWLTDQVSRMYLSAMDPWLISKLASPESNDESLRYALTERLQAGIPLPPGEIARKVDAVLSRLSAAHERESEGLPPTRDVASLLKTLTS